MNKTSHDFLSQKIFFRSNLKPFQIPFGLSYINCFGPPIIQYFIKHFLKLKAQNIDYRDIIKAHNEKIRLHNEKVQANSLKFE